VLPGSFSADEPIEEVLQAARLAPDISFFITGRTQSAARHGHDLSNLPPNVRTPGYLPLDDFEDLLRGADCVLALTREEGIQLSVCNEALGFGRAMVASDTAVLRSLFADAAVMVKTDDPASLAAACREALAQQAQREEASRLLAQKRRAQWQAGPWAELRRLLGMNA
jgi:glycosyltransferase involved in cell wall biosynthesis